MCGIIGIVNANGNNNCCQALIDGLTVLQHRGQDAAGIVTINDNRFNLLKNVGTGDIQSIKPILSNDLRKHTSN